VHFKRVAELLSSVFSKVVLALLRWSPCSELRNRRLATLLIGFISKSGLQGSTHLNQSSSAICRPTLAPFVPACIFVPRQRPTVFRDKPVCIAISRAAVLHVARWPAVQCLFLSQLSPQKSSSSTVWINFTPRKGRFDISANIYGHTGFEIQHNSQARRKTLQAAS